MSARIDAHDWSKTVLGPRSKWPQSLKTALSICLGSKYPMFIWWGDRDRIIFYNDAYIPVTGAKHPRQLGARADSPEGWGDIWEIVGRESDVVFREGTATWNDSTLLVMNRHGYFEETYFTWSYSPILDESGGVGGLFCACMETTAQVLSQRRLKLLGDLGTGAAASSAREVMFHAGSELGKNLQDLPFTLLYLLDPSGEKAELSATSGILPGTKASPHELALGDPSSERVWELKSVALSRKPFLVEDLRSRFQGVLPVEPWGEAPHSAYILPVEAPSQDQLAGFLVAGLSPRLSFDSDYRAFTKLVAGHIATNLASARAYEEEKRRMEVLAEIDRAKTAFFSNVSHEFRTPLTLMLGPLEDSLADVEEPLPPRQKERQELTYRNALRLLKLVNTLLDFSRIEAGRIQALYRPTDLSHLTADLAGMFRSAIEGAGLKFEVDVPSLEELVYVDREMWEKIVLNLLSNAFKFTLQGSVLISLRRVDGCAQLRVRDTGSGIPESQLPRVFERFHRVEGTHGRSHEGTGIGLALIQELVKLHGGTIRVESQLGVGSTFIVQLPLGSAHLPAEQVNREDSPTSIGNLSVVFVEEALRWLPESEAPALEALPGRGTSSFFENRDVSPSGKTTKRSRILFADDNADMRAYVKGLLSKSWSVEVVSDGEAALQAARAHLPDLVLSDVMMPKLNGFELLQELRKDPKTSSVSVILLSARAGEESKIEGLEAGADDYIVKPFSAKELVARVETHLKLNQVQQELRDALKSRDEFLSIASHELKTPLSSLMLQIHLTKRHRERGDLSIYSPEKVDQRIDQTERQIDRLNRLIDDMLDIARIRSGKLTIREEKVVLEDLVCEVIDRLGPNLKDAGTPVTFHFLETMVGEWDRFRIEQVVTNLFTNAMRYGNQKPVEVSLEKISTNPSSIRLTVRDQGIGISPEACDRIFNRFERGESSAEGRGLGLGLYITRQIVEAHGGRIWAESRGKDQGSTFVVELPTHHDIGAPVGEPTSGSVR